MLSFGVNVIINNSTVSNNTAGGGGGGISVFTGINTGDFVKINNSTLSGNSAPRGGGILESNSIITVRSSTIFANQATSGQGGGVILDPSLGPASIHFENSILAGNTATANSQDCFKSPASVVTSTGYNLFGDVTDCPIPGPQPGDQVVTDPKLEALGDNGGPTPTHLPMNDSPAVNGGNPAGCKDADGNLLTQDQRGQPRPVGGNCDIGAVELGTAIPATPAPTSGGCSLEGSGLEAGSRMLGLLQLPLIGFWWMRRKR